jgi:hypothetical protein
MIVEPTKVKPRFLRSLLSASDSVEVRARPLVAVGRLTIRRAADEAPEIGVEDCRIPSAPQESAARS